jgi:Zn-dependent peptidase ImmA (M78 family)
MVPSYPVWDIEKRAQNVLHQAYPDGLPEAYIDIEWIIEAVIGLEILPVPGLKGSWDIDGLLCCYVGGGHCIVVDADLMDHSPNRYRFTLGEELGHYLLHADYIPKVTAHSDALRTYATLPGRWRMDRNARRFAAAVLMPMETLVPNTEDLYAQIVGTVGFNDPDAVRKYLTAQMAKRYRVSTQSMRFRLREYPARLDKRIDQALQEKLRTLP